MEDEPVSDTHTIIRNLFKFQQIFRQKWYGVDNKFNPLYLGHWWHLIPNEIMVNGYKSYNHVKEEYDDSDFTYMNRILEILYNKEDMNLFMKFHHTPNYILVPNIIDWASIKENEYFDEDSVGVVSNNIKKIKTVKKKIKKPKIVVSNNHHKQKMSQSDHELWLLKKNYTTKLNKLKFINTPEATQQIQLITSEMNQAILALQESIKNNENVTEISENGTGISENGTGISENVTGISENDGVISENDGGISENDCGISENVGNDGIFGDVLDIEGYTNSELDVGEDSDGDREVVLQEVDGYVRVNKKIFHENFENKINEKYLKSLKDKKALSEIVKSHLSQQINICLQSILDLPRTNQPIRAYLDISIKDEKNDVRVTHFLRAKLYPCYDDLKVGKDGICDFLYAFTIPANFPIYVNIPDGNVLLTTFYLPYTTIRGGNKWNLVIRQHHFDAKNTSISAYKKLEGGDVELCDVVVKRIRMIRFTNIGPDKIKVNNLVPVNVSNDTPIPIVGNIFTDFHDKIIHDLKLLEKYFEPEVTDFLTLNNINGWNIRYLDENDFDFIGQKFGANSRKKVQIIKDLLLFYKSYVNLST